MIRRIVCLLHGHMWRVVDRATMPGLSFAVATERCERCGRIERVITGGAT